MKDYKKILEGLVNIINNTEKSDIGFANICTFIGENCPELKEYEDERIRKEIINYIDKATGCKRWVAWLEKQGKPVEINPTEFDLQLNRLLVQFETLTKEELASSLSFYLNVVKNDYLSDNVEPTDYNSIDPHFGEPVDKVEPKFKVGDWVVTDKGDTVQIVAVNNGYYTLHNGMDFNMSYVDKCWRKWTIQDAKDGDVLCDYHEAYDNPLIFILKKFEHVNFGLVRPSNYISYCFLTAGDIQKFKKGTYHHEHNIKPATKEQREQLEKAMADAGYVFDFEKKELKEIENEEYDGEDYGIDSLWHAKNILEKTLGKVDGYQTDDGILDHKCAITAVDKLYKHSIAWSENDKHWMQKVIDFMNHPDLIKATPTLAKDTINWLKSLKDRVHPQPKQEWSEKDESNFQGIIDELKANKHHAPDSDLPTYDRFLSWFKSLKERYVWKPSDEQMATLEYYMHTLIATKHSKVLFGLYQDLKKLRE